MTRTESALADSIEHSKQVEKRLAIAEVALQECSAHRAALIAALEFYADEGSWAMQREKYLTGGGTYLVASKTKQDEGDIARATLAQARSGGGT